MRKIVILGVVLIIGLLGSRRADACTCSGGGCDVLEPIAIAMGVGIVGGYGYGTGYMVYRDLTDEQQSLEYGAAEAGINLAAGSLFATGAVQSFKDGDTGTGLVLSGFTAVHGTLAAHGVYRIYTQRGELRAPPDRTIYGAAAIAYAANTIVWSAQLSDHHTRGYGIAEAAVNAPIAAGLGYLANERARDGEVGATLLYGGMAVVSGALAGHGIKNAFAPSESPGLDLLGTDGAQPTLTIVSDGRSYAPGIGASGTW